MTNKKIWDKVKSALNAQTLEIDQASWELFVSDLDQYYANDDDPMVYQLYTDGAARGNPGPAGIGLVIRDGKGKTLKEHYEYVGECTNNVAEYMALIKGLELVTALGGKQVQVFSDSELMTKQLNGEYKVKNKALIGLYTQARQQLTAFNNYRLNHVKRGNNAQADRLANMAIDAQ